MEFNYFLPVNLVFGSGKVLETGELAKLYGKKALLLSIVVYQVVQFIENQFIYPRVVGGSVGLAPLWTLSAALIGGNLFGVIGMIFAIPVTAVLYVLVKDDANRRLQRKKIDL